MGGEGRKRLSLHTHHQLTLAPGKAMKSSKASSGAHRPSSSDSYTHDESRTHAPLAMPCNRLSVRRASPHTTWDVDASITEVTRNPPSFMMTGRRLVFSLGQEGGQEGEVTGENRVTIKEKKATIQKEQSNVTFQVLCISSMFFHLTRVSSIFNLCSS